MLILTGVASNRKMGVKQAIVDVLSMKWPLSLKTLHYLLSKRYAITVSYQAVHKAVGQLIEDSIIEKNGSAYHLSRIWIASIKDFGIETELAYSQQNGQKDEFELVAALLKQD